MHSILILLCTTGFVAAADPIREDFESAKVGEMPKGWTIAKTGKGEGSVWKIVEDSTAPKGSKILSQVAKGPSALFNLCVCDAAKYQDVTVSVAFKANAGELDQGGGLVWRYADADNYYIARMNPLEDNFRLYKVVAGKRIQLATKEELKVAPGTWHTIAVTMKGDAIVCSLDGKKHLEAKDDAIKAAGKVGLWTKADAQTSFDDFRAGEPK